MKSRADLVSDKLSDGIVSKAVAKAGGGLAFKLHYNIFLNFMFL